MYYVVTSKFFLDVPTLEQTFFWLLRAATAYNRLQHEVVPMSRACVESGLAQWLRSKRNVHGGLAC